jgi:hypothetical protein
MDAHATSSAGRSAIEPAGSTTSHSAIEPANLESPAPTAQGPTEESPAGVDAPAEPRSPGFRERGGMRRRARFLRKARELAYRDLGGLVFEMHRLGHRNDELVAAKLNVLRSFDGELHALEAALGERRPVTVLRETGIAACPRCAAIHGGEDHFCPACGMPMGRHADRPIAATPAVVAGAPAGSTAPGGAIAPAPTVSPAQLPLSAPPYPAVAPPPLASPSTTPPPAPPASPPTRTHPPAAARPSTRPPAQEDRPTEIIRPQDDAE